MVPLHGNCPYESWEPYTLIGWKLWPIIYRALMGNPARGHPQWYKIGQDIQTINMYRMPVLMTNAPINMYRMHVLMTSAPINMYRMPVLMTNAPINMYRMAVLMTNAPIPLISEDQRRKVKHDLGSISLAQVFIVIRRSWSEQNRRCTSMSCWNYNACIIIC